MYLWIFELRLNQEWAVFLGKIYQRRSKSMPEFAQYLSQFRIAGTNFLLNLTTFDHATP